MTKTREEAIALIAADELTHMPLEERGSLLLNWWGIDSDDIEYAALSDGVKNALAASPDGPADPEDPKYDELLQVAIRYEFFGVQNSYLETRLAKLGQVAVVAGFVEPLARCPCCGYSSLRQRGEYDVCGVCFWEDDGGEAEEAWSGPNHMTLGEARKNFESLGAVEEQFVSKVLPDGKERFYK